MSRVGQLIWDEIQRRRQRRRLAPSAEDKRTLWSIFGPKLRCWICGYLFPQHSVEKFLDNNQASFSMPRFVDFLQPIGLQERDLFIEVDHVVPVAAGGMQVDNLRLACGWCNIHKGARLSIFDVPSRSSLINHPRLGWTTVPRPFWVVRLLALRRRCEWEGGCNKTTTNSHLKIAPWRKNGAINPTNMRITCAEHDPLGTDRLIDANLLRSQRVDES
jgi:hypothetical protein